MPAKFYLKSACQFCRAPSPCCPCSTVSSPIPVRRKTVFCCIQGRGLGFQESNNLEQMGFDMSAAGQPDEPAKRVKLRRWGPMTGLQIQNSVLTQLQNKKNTYGLGFDPYANSEEFRVAKKRLREETAQTQRHAVDNKGAQLLEHLNNTTIHQSCCCVDFGCVDFGCVDSGCPAAELGMRQASHTHACAEREFQRSSVADQFTVVSCDIPYLHVRF